MIWLLYAILTAVFASAAAIAHKKVLSQKHAMEFCTALSIMVLVFTLPLFWTLDYSQISLVPLLILYLASILGSIAVLMVNKAIRHMEISECIPLMALSPLFTTVVAYLMIGEVLSLTQIGGILLLIVGSYLLELRPHHSLLEPFAIMRESKYVHYIFGALFLFAFTGTADRFVMTTYQFDPLAYACFINLFVAFNFFMMYQEHYKLKDLAGSLKHVGYWMVFAALLTLGGRIMQMTAISLAPVGLVIAIKRLSTLFTTVIGGGIFHEHNILRRSIACIIMVAGAVVMVL